MPEGTDQYSNPKLNSLILITFSRWIAKKSPSNKLDGKIRSNRRWCRSFITILHSSRLRLYGMRYWMSYERFTKMSFGGWSLTSKNIGWVCGAVSMSVVYKKFFLLPLRLSNIFPYTLRRTLVSLIAQNMELIPLIRRIKEITNCLQWPVAIDIVIELMAVRVLVWLRQQSKNSPSS